MHLYLLRHAQSESNARWEANPDDPFHYPDPGLTEVGHQQAAAAAAALAKIRGAAESGYIHDTWNYKGFGITHIYSSLMRRAVTTANYVADQLDMPILGRTDLHEWGGLYEKDEETGERFGIPGSDRSFFESTFPRVQLPEDFNENGWWSRPYETPEMVPLRARSVLTWLTKKHRDTDDSVLLVSHGGFINHLVSTIINLSPEQTQENLNRNLWLVMNNTGLTRLRISTDFTGIVYMNRIAHLPPELVT